MVASHFAYCWCFVVADVDKDVSLQSQSDADQSVDSSPSTTQCDFIHQGTPPIPLPRTKKLRRQSCFAAITDCHADANTHLYV